MSINFDNALGVHPQALVLREKRAEVLASNLANADTPGYKARDMDFQAALKQAMPMKPVLENTRQGHFATNDSLSGATMLYRNPQQPSLDGNTVEDHVEQAKYTENAVQYQASLRFINGRFSGMIAALRGE